MEEEKCRCSTAMERLCRELMDELLGNSITAYCWCKGHGISVVDSTFAEDIEHARADIERRIADADLADDKARDRALVDWRERIAELDTMLAELGADDGDEALFIVRELMDEHYELKDLREAGRIMPEGVSWPRYEDGKPVGIGDVLRTMIGRDEYRVIGVSSCGRASVVAEDVGDDESIVLLDPELIDRAPKAVGADGREVKVGDTVWDEVGREWEVVTASGGGCRLRDARPESSTFIKESFADPRTLTHERPDSWERLREDARKYYADYWGCIGFCCDKCPSILDGKKPNERYDTAGCHTAEQLDLVARAERLAGVAR